MDQVDVEELLDLLSVSTIFWKKYNHLLAGMLETVATFSDRRRTAFLNCAVTKPTVRYASIKPADYLVAATLNPAFTCTTAMFGTEAFANRGGGAACHGARLFVPTAVYVAMWRSTTVCVGSAAIKLALAVCTMLAADTTCICKGGATFCLAYFFLTVTAVLPAVSIF